MKLTRLNTPKFEGKSAKSFWKAITSEWTLDADEARILELACRSLDDAEVCLETVRAQGRFTTNRFGVPVEHPALLAGLKARAQFGVLVRQLGLHADEVKKPMGRPPKAWNTVELRNGELQ